MAETKEVTVTAREWSSCCHPERSDCLRPLAGRICLSKIRFFATLVKRHKGRRGSE